ncbi:MAG: DUF3391 domain-containing protein [Pseudomonadota bacterium]
MDIKVPVARLNHGMFVHELDRPWLDTPFALQGFLIRDEDQVQRLRQYCSYGLGRPRPVPAGRHSRRPDGGPGGRPRRQAAGRRHRAVAAAPAPRRAAEGAQPFPRCPPIRETILYEERTSFEEERPAARAACTRPTAIPTAT